MKGLFERCSAACFHADKAARNLTPYRAFFEEEANAAVVHVQRASEALKRAAKSILRRYDQGGYEGADDDERRDAAAFDRCAHALQNLAITEAGSLMEAMESSIARDVLEGPSAQIWDRLDALLAHTAAVEDAASALSALDEPGQQARTCAP